MQNTLTYWQGYLAMFHFLDKYWEESKLDDLGGLLGSMSPLLFQGGVPIDDVMVVDWLGVVKHSDITKEDVEIEECYNCMIQYLDIQAIKFGLNLEELKEILIPSCENKSSNGIWGLWIDCCLSAKSSGEDRSLR